jgi:Brp/Blh family beta-carotene 15,15'-monooxygenase
MTRRLDVFFRLFPLAILALAGGAAAWAGPAWSTRHAAVPWLVALAVVGLPHGAADLAVLARFRGPAAARRLFAAATVLSCAVLLALVLAPRLALAAFVMVSVWHFGVAHARGQSPPPRAGATSLVIAAVARGAGVLGMPLAVWPAETAAVADRVVALAAGPGPPIAPALVRAWGLTLLAAAAAALACEAWASWRSPAGRRRTAATGVDLLASGLLAAATHPLFSVGVYFLCWHAWREMRPLLHVLAPRSLTPDGRPVGFANLIRGIAAVHWAALPLLIPTWAAVAAVWWFRSPAHTPTDLAVVSLAAYIVVTPAHEAILDIVGLDRPPALGLEPSRRGGYRRPGAPCSRQSSSHNP